MIPADPDGNINRRRLRRTLAWFIYRRPRGRVALGIQYGHLHASTTDGYGGRVSAGLRDLFPMEEAFAISGSLHVAGEHPDTNPTVSGPAAQRYRAAAAEHRDRYEGLTLSVKQAAALMDNPNMRVYDAAGQTLACCFDARKALCRKQPSAATAAAGRYPGTPRGARRSPDADPDPPPPRGPDRAPRRHRRPPCRQRSTHMTDPEPQRQAIRDLILPRLLDGAPIRSDGKLTISSLAVEADVKRWILTHRHLDLQDEFRSRVTAHGRDPEPVRQLKARVDELKVENARLRTELREAKAACSLLERLVAVEALEAQSTPRSGAPPGPTTLRPVT